MGPRDRSVTTALLTTGRSSEFMQQFDPARPGPRVLPCTADSSSGSPSHECVAARSSDLYSHTLPKIFFFFVRRAGPRPQSRKVLSAGVPIDIFYGSGPMGPRDRSVSTALLTSGRRSEFLRQSDPARPGQRVLPRTADSSSGSPSHECVATRSYDLYSHTLPKIRLFSSGGPGRDPSLVRSYWPGRRLISSMALAPRTACRTFLVVACVSEPINPTRGLKGGSGLQLQYYFGAGVRINEGFLWAESGAPRSSVRSRRHLGHAPTGHIVKA
ncbi:hypothetical protein NDU88_007190 [Pleurodeles waltl]|uniref:Uncharacterized protein n=1 Tax=Pleurodeles waltl TaxID=8319 RepID=A0AAV7PN98_PLEWA|nr:hypothetical protein NDU88_007190 [Pleurodeles waltl]